MSKITVELEIGDSVSLKSGGPQMTICDIVDDKITCQWFINGEIRQATFIKNVLNNCSLTRTQVCGTCGGTGRYGNGICGGCGGRGTVIV